MQVGEYWIGLDVGEDRTNVCVLNDAGEPLHEATCATSADDIVVALAGFPKERIALIAVETGVVGHLVRKLRARGYPVDMFEARKAAKFLAIRRSKTDASDARGLADLGRLGTRTVSKVHLVGPDCQNLRAELTLREQLLRVRVATELGIRSRLRAHGRPFKIPRRVGELRREVDLETTLLQVEEGIDLKAQLRPLVDIAESLRDYLRALDRDIAKRAAENPACVLMMQIPGVGSLCALAFYSAVEDPHRFARPDDVAAYFGLVPRRHQSGETSFTRGITKTGSSLVRKCLVASAMMMRIRDVDCALRDWHIALRERVGPSRARVAAARKLAVLMLLIWKTGTPFEPYPHTRSRPATAPDAGIALATGGGE